MEKLTEIIDLMSRLGEKVSLMHLYYGINSNGKEPQALKEETLNRILDKHGKNGFVVLSANRTDGITTRQENNENTRALIADIRAEKEHYSYLPVYGGYVGTDGVVDSYEPSFIVFNYNRKGEPTDFENLKSFAISMCGKYNQNSVLIVPPNQEAFYINSNGVVVGKQNGNTILNDPTQQYFTSLVKTRNLDADNPDRLKRWTYDMEFFEGKQWNLFANPDKCTLNEQRQRESLGEILLQLGTKRVFD